VNLLVIQTYILKRKLPVLSSLLSEKDGIEENAVKFVHCQSNDVKKPHTLPFCSGEFAMVQNLVICCLNLMNLIL
jgi:hypothetical protein